MPPSAYPVRTERLRLLLDTHVWLWWISGDHRLGPAARDAISRAAEVFLSAASAWEVVIKAGLRKLDFPHDFDLRAQLERDHFIELPISIEHVLAVGRLQRLHRDPFDRVLAAQARFENLSLVTADSVFSRYDVAVLSAVS